MTAPRARVHDRPVEDAVTDVPPSDAAAAPAVATAGPATAAPRIVATTAGPTGDRAAFTRRHRLLSLLLALHLPALLGVAALLGRAPQDVLVEASLVLLALTAAQVPGASPRVRALAVGIGLASWSVAVVVLTSTLVWGALHGGVVLLAASAHLGRSWRAYSPRASEDDDAGVCPDATDDHAPPPAAVEPAPPTAAGEGQVVEVQEVFTGVWTAKQRVRPTTRLVRVPRPSASRADAPAPEHEAVTTAAHVDEVATAGPEASEARAGDDAGAAGQDPSSAGRSVSEPQDPDLTREVLTALHLGAVGEPERAESSHAR